jgi:hypothetical protein
MTTTNAANIVTFHHREGRQGRAIAQAISRRLPTAAHGFESGLGHVDFVVDKAELGQVFSEYFRFPCQSSHRLLHTHHHTSSGAGTVGHLLTSVRVGSVPTHTNKQTPWTESGSELYLPSDRRLSAKLEPNLRIEGAT